MCSAGDRKYLFSNLNGSRRYIVNIYSPVQMGSAGGSKYLSSNSNGSRNYKRNMYFAVQMGPADM